MPHDLPVLLISGEKDPVENLGKGVKNVEAQFRETGMWDVSCHLYPDDRHGCSMKLTDRTYIRMSWSG
ncbi:MAG: hypothetical protein LUF30_12755 [Lachnospiraceae bacterium]|nr:hypothetical protein [Lachnospiraceae bacterium]